MVTWRFTRGVAEQTKSFLDGFNEVVPLEWLKYFDERELEVSLLDADQCYWIIVSTISPTRIPLMMYMWHLVVMSILHTYYL